MSKKKYMNMRNYAHHTGCLYAFPSYRVVSAANYITYLEGISITEDYCEVAIQKLLDHTVQRVFLCLQDLDVQSYTDIVMISKYGMDGTAGFSTYKYRGNTTTNEQDLFHVTLVPLRIIGTDKINKKNTIIWSNPKPSSTRTCRPIKFMYRKETPDLVRSEAKEIEDEIKELNPTVVHFNKLRFEVNHDLILSMIDGKVSQALTHTSSSQVCIICAATPSQMNDLDTVCSRAISRESLKYGISPLHSYIRFYECCLHIMYRQDIKNGEYQLVQIKINFRKRKK